MGTRDEEPYDLDADPGEGADLARQRPEETARLRRLVRDWIAANPLEIGTNPPIDAETLETLRSLGYSADDHRVIGDRLPREQVLHDEHHVRGPLRKRRRTNHGYQYSP